MPLLSIVLPVHGVAGYLRECLDSILSQTFIDFEVVAVDDHSPDNCGEILDEYASRDPRVRVVHLSDNVGLGRARNVGLDEAVGDYVWFVDSDDLVPAGSVKAIAATITRTDPDVVLIDHARLYTSGQTKRSRLGRKFRDSDFRDEPFAAADEPFVLRPLHTAWSRVVRRDFLIGLGLRFEPGWYEDVSVVFPVTAAAERIAVIYRVCYLYRQRRQGSITHSAGDDRHFDMFAQYRKVFEEFERLGIDDPGLRTVMFDRMQWHYRWVLNESGRVPEHRRHEFFDQMSADWRRYRPSSHVVPHGVEGIRQRFTAEDRWTAYSVARFGRRAMYKASTWGRKKARVAKSTARTCARHLRDAGMREYYAAQRARPLDDNLAAFAAYWYRGVRCSPAAIYQKLRELAPHIQGVWIVKRNRVVELPPGTPYVVEGSAAYYRLLASARYLVNNVNFPDLYVKRPGSIYIQTHHGTPLKVMGMDHYKYPVGAAGVDLPALLKRCDNWDFSISTSPFNTEVWQREYPCDFETLEVGYPRNDRLVTATSAEIARMRAGLGLRDGEVAVLYAPTHREYQAGYQPMLDLDELADQLGPAFRVLARAHYFYEKTATLTETLADADVTDGAVIDVSLYPDVEDLYLAADVLITDYSSIMFDYAYLDRPMVIFAPDWDTYRRTRGVTFDLMEQPPGVVATEFAELIDVFRTGAYSDDVATKARADFRDRFCPHMDGRSAEKVVRRVFGV